MNCSGHCTDVATQSGLARAGFARAIACAVVLVLGGLDVVPAWASTVSNVTISSTPTNNTYAVGVDINVDVLFAAVVHVDQTESCPNDPKRLTLVLNVGEHPRHATFIEGSGSSDMTLHFRYTVQYGDYDGDGISIGPGVVWLQGGCIVTATNAAVSRAFDGLAANPSHMVDGISPMPVAMDPVKIISTPYQGDTYGLGEDIKVTVTFDETVHVDETDTELGLVLSIGQHSRRATFVGGSGSETLTFRYTVQTGDDDKVDGISIGAGPGSLIGARIEDFAGNLVVRTFPGVAADDGHKVDGIKPTLREVRIASTPVADETYGLNEEIEVEVTFGEDVHVREAGDLELIIAIGQHSRAAAFVDGSGTPELMFRYVVQSDDDDDDGISIGPNALRGGIIEDAAGNPVDRTFAGRPAARGHKVDGATTAQSSVRIVSTPVGNGTYRLDEEITLEVDFGEDVYVDEMDSELVLVLSIGQQSRAARFVGGSGTDTLTFRYVVQSDDYDDDGISIDPNALQGGSILDAQNTPVDRTSARLAADPGHKVDGTTAALKAVRIVSTPDSGRMYGLNEEIRVAVDFGEEVHVTSTGGDLTLVLSIGEHLRDATLADGSGTETLTFRYVVQSEDYDDDGISIGPNALQGGVVEDAAGNPVERAFAGLEANSRHRVDGVSPAVTSVRFDSRPGADGIYGLGDEIRAEVEFDEDVHVTNTAGDLVLLLAIGEHSREATFVGGSGTDILTFRYVVQSDDSDDDGISIGPNALRGGVIEDGAGNAVDRTFEGRSADSRHQVDGASPPTTRVRIVSTPGDRGFYGLSDEIRVEVEFDEEVHVSDAGGDLTLVLSIGEHSRAAALAGGSGTDTLTFRYVVQSDDYDSDGISIGPNALRGADIEDAQGNAVDRSFVALSADSGHKVDGVSPSLTRVRIVSTPGESGFYGSGAEIRVEVEFDEEVHVTSDASLTLSIGEHLRAATFVGGSGTDKLTFRHVVQSDDYDDDGISIGSSALQGDIEDAAGNEVVGTFEGFAADSGHKVDGVSPALTRVRIVSTPGESGFYGLDEEIRVEVEFGEEVHVTSDGSDLSVMLSIGEHLRAAAFVGGSGTDTLTFRYAVQSDDHDDDGVSIGPNALQGGTIEDGAGNAVVRSFGGLAAASGHKVDGVSPSLTEVRIVSEPDDSGFYGLNAVIRVEVDFGEGVHVTDAAGDLALILSIGEHLRAATFVGGSGTETLTFRYTVQAGDADKDGISIGPNALRGGRIEDAAGNPVDRTFAGLAANGDHRVDGVRPVLTQVEIVSDPDASGFYGLDDEIRIEVAFGEVVHVDDSLDLSLVLSIGEYSRAATFVGGSGTKMLTFRYVVQENDYDDDGISIGANALRGGRIEDAAGNPVDRTFAGLAADGGQTVDGRVDRVIPAILRVAITSDAGSNDTYTTDDIIRVDVGFNVPVYVTGAPPVLELAIGPALRDALFVEGSGTPTLKFEYTVEAGDTDTDGISIAANSLTGGITDANGNAVDLTFEAVPRSASHKVSAELLLFPLSLTLIVGQSHTLDLLGELERLGVEYVGDFEWSSDDATVATATLSGSMLTITSVAEGTARIAVAATDAAIFLFFGVTVETSAAETAVLEGAMAAVGRGLLASAGSTIGARLELTGEGSSDVWGGRGIAPVSVAASPQWSVPGGSDHWGSPLGYGQWNMDDPYLQGSMRYTPAQLLRGTRFEMPLRGFGNPVNSWAVWGAGDWHAFEGAGDDGLYDGSLTSAYLGVDARGDGWISGASISRAVADASYEYGGTAGGKGRLETELNVIHPYVQWEFRDRGKMWAILGFGTGEATAEREGQEVASEPSNLSMRMGLGGMRYSLGRLAGLDLAVRGDAGFAQLETDEGPRAVQGLAVNVQRLRIGAEASLPMALWGVPVSPFIDVAGRYDGGDGATGGGVELAGGFRYQGSAVGLEVKGRALAMHADDSYSEEGVKATLVVGPDSRKGFRLLLSPRWGGAADAMDIFRSRGHPFAGALRRENRGWGLGTRVSYGFDMWRRPGTIMPFGEVDLSREDYRQARLGVSYELASAILGLPHRLEISGESAESDSHGTILRFLLTGQAHF